MTNLRNGSFSRIFSSWIMELNNREYAAWRQIRRHIAVGAANDNHHKILILKEFANELIPENSVFFEEYKRIYNNSISVEKSPENFTEKINIEDSSLNKEGELEEIYEMPSIGKNSRKSSFRNVDKNDLRYLVNLLDDIVYTRAKIEPPRAATDDELLARVQHVFFRSFAIKFTAIVMLISAIMIGFVSAKTSWFTYTAQEKLEAARADFDRIANEYREKREQVNVEFSTFSSELSQYFDDSKRKIESIMDENSNFRNQVAQVERLILNNLKDLEDGAYKYLKNQIENSMYDIEQVYVDGKAEIAEEKAKEIGFLSKEMKKLNEDTLRKFRSDVANTYRNKINDVSNDVLKEGSELEIRIENALWAFEGELDQLIVENRNAIKYANVINWIENFARGKIVVLLIFVACIVFAFLFLAVRQNQSIRDLISSSGPSEQSNG